MAALGLICLAGCSTGGVSNSDTAEIKKEFSQANYEKAMIAAGKGAELQREKDAAAKRGGQ